MQYFRSHQDPSADFAPPPWTGDVPGRSNAALFVPDRPKIALLYAVTDSVMELLGPIFWAVLIVLFIRAELILTGLIG